MIHEVNFTTAGIHSWVCPEGVTSITIEIVGAGGYSVRATAAGSGASGGGSGGCYVKRNNYPVTPFATYQLQVGDGGAFVSSVNAVSWFNSITTVCAAAGMSSAVPEGGVGYRPTSGQGVPVGYDVLHQGGRGGQSIIGTSPPALGGGGGSSGNKYNPGVDAIAQSGQGAISYDPNNPSVSLPGRGGNGSSTNQVVGSVGEFPGGGAGGSRSTTMGTAGGTGLVKLSWESPDINNTSFLPFF